MSSIGTWKKIINNLLQFLISCCDRTVLFADTLQLLSCSDWRSDKAELLPSRYALDRLLPSVSIDRPKTIPSPPLPGLTFDNFPAPLAWFHRLSEQRPLIMGRLPLVRSLLNVSPMSLAGAVHPVWSPSSASDGQKAEDEIIAATSVVRWTRLLVAPAPVLCTVACATRPLSRLRRRTNGAAVVAAAANINSF